MSRTTNNVSPEVRAIGTVSAALFLCLQSGIVSALNGLCDGGVVGVREYP